MTLPPSLPPIPPQAARSPAAPIHPASWGAADDLDLFSLGAFDNHDGDVRVPLRGELDLATGPALLAGLALHADPVQHASAAGAAAGDIAAPAPGGLRSSRRGTVQLDMSDRTFLDSSGLTALDDARAMLVAAGWRVCLTRPRPAVLIVLNFAINAGWFPADAACADVEVWGQHTATGLTLTPWPALPAVAGPGHDREARRDSIGQGSS
jgi:anti-anti-sigma regulatory factor